MSMKGPQRKEKLEPAVRKRVRQPLTIGALVTVVFLIIVLASTSNEIAEISYVVEKSDNQSWRHLQEQDLIKSRQASDVAVNLAKMELSITELLFGPTHLGTAIYASNLASLYISRGEFATAEGLLNKALAIRKEKLGLNHPFVAQTLGSLAFVQAHQQKYDAAVASLEQTAAIQESLPGLRPERWTTLANAGYILLAAKKPEQAEVEMRKSLAEVEATQVKDYVDRAFALHNLANVYLSQSKFEPAEKLLLEAQAILEKQIGITNETVLSSLAVLAFTQESLGKYVEAEKNLSLLIESRRRVNGPNALIVASDLASLGRVLARQKKNDQAKTYFEQSMTIATNSAATSRSDLKTKIAILQQYLAFLKTTSDPQLPQIEARIAQLSASLK